MSLDAKNLDAEKLAESEIKCREAYHNRDWPGLEDAIKTLRKEQFGVEISDRAAAFFTDAATAYINYKEYYVKGDKETAEGQLRLAKLYMQAHYKDIMEKIEGW